MVQANSHPSAPTFQEPAFGNYLEASVATADGTGAWPTSQLDQFEPGIARFRAVPLGPGFNSGVFPRWSLLPEPPLPLREGRGVVSVCPYGMGQPSRLAPVPGRREAPSLFPFHRVVPRARKPDSPLGPSRGPHLLQSSWECCAIPAPGW